MRARNRKGSGSERVWSGISTNIFCPVNFPARPFSSVARIVSGESNPEVPVLEPGTTVPVLEPGTTVAIE